MIHIHQGGTLNTFCQTPLVDVVNDGGVIVDWTDAAEATCSPCSSAFPVVTR